MRGELRYLRTPEFSRDLKKLLKRFRTLEEDLRVLQERSVFPYHLRDLDAGGIFPIPGFCTDTYQVLKVKKFASRSLPGRGVMSGLRLIYGYDPAAGEVTFLELYLKADQALESRERIRNFLNQRLQTA